MFAFSRATPWLSLRGYLQWRDRCARYWAKSRAAETAKVSWNQDRSDGTAEKIIWDKRTAPVEEPALSLRIGLRQAVLHHGYNNLRTACR